jgi:rhamnose utilization protein RhaD (predicted bifunctional aldolase and dehydrogenase)
MAELTAEQLKVQNDLITLSHAVGEESRQLAILGEGNTSGLCSDGTFWVKASGSQLGNLTAAGLSLVDLEKALGYLRNDAMSDDAVKDALKESLVDPGHRTPSVETMVHAVCLSTGGAKWVAHTHAVSCNAILCSKAGAQPFMGHLFPDGIVVCGRNVAVVPYVDPGFTLAKEFEKAILRFQDAHGVNPKLVLMENHGIASLGQTATEALNIQLMADKWAKVLLGTAAFGGPNFLPDSVADRIENRPDEHYRRKMIAPA